jgi:murein DD-endopeptidase MepM/ murein hydrolase activator NlpD
MYHHYAHIDKFASFVKKGTKVKRGEIIAHVGNTGSRWAHLHYETRIVAPPKWTSYTKGMSKEKVRRTYPDPSKYIERENHIPALYTNQHGWDYLDAINKAETKFHPGVDINSGWGDQDLGNPIRSTCDGTVVFKGEHNGWGKHLWILEDPEPEADPEYGLEQAGRIFLRVSKHGEAWYVDTDGNRHYMGSTPAEMLEFVEKMAVGITENDIMRIPKA